MLAEGYQLYQILKLNEKVDGLRDELGDLREDRWDG